MMQPLGRWEGSNGQTLANRRVFYLAPLPSRRGSDTLDYDSLALLRHHRRTDHRPVSGKQESAFESASGGISLVLPGHASAFSNHLRLQCAPAIWNHPV